MLTSNFIVPFDPETRQTILPLDPDGQPYPLDWWHLSMENGNTVLCQVRGGDAVIQAMKDDISNYCWLEDKVAIVEDIRGDVVLEGGGIDPLSAEQVLPDRAAIKDWLTSKKTETAVAELGKGGKLPSQAQIAVTTAAVQAAIDELPWEDPIEGVCVLHNQTVEGYKSSGLG